MRVTQTIGHGAVKFGKEASRVMRQNLPAEDVVLAPTLNDGTARIVWNAIATERLRDLNSVFGDSEPRVIEIPVNNLRGTNVRFVDDGTNIVLDLGSELCRSLFGCSPSELDGRTRAVFELYDEAMVVRPLRKVGRPEFQKQRWCENFKFVAPERPDT